MLWSCKPVLNRLSIDEIEGHRHSTETAAILEHLVGLDTTSHKSNADPVDWVCQYLSSHGVESERIVVTTGEKFNIRATIGPDTSNGIVMSGHTNVVLVEGQVWEIDPFKLTEKDGRLYGRGSADMKGFLACFPAAVPAMTKSQISRPIHVAFSCDEETGGLGVPDLIDRLALPTAIRPNWAQVPSNTPVRSSAISMRWANGPTASHPLCWQTRGRTGILSGHLR